MKNRVAGFTVIELLMVMGTMGVLTAVALPKIDVSRYRAIASMQAIGTTLLAAQRLAVSRQHNVIVSFDQTASALIVHQDANNDNLVNGGELVRRIPLGERIVFGRASTPAHALGASPINFTKQIGGRPAVIFRRNGSASEHGSLYVTTRHAAMQGGRPQDTRLLEIERATGRTSWYIYGGSGWQRRF